MGAAVMVAVVMQLAPAAWVPTPLDPPLPPIVAPPPPPARGHWHLQRLQRGELVAGVVAGAASYLATAAAGLGTRDYWLCVPVAGPVLGTVYPHDTGVAAVYGMFLIAADVAMQGVFGPLYVGLGLKPRWTWVSDP